MPRGRCIAIGLNNVNTNSKAYSGVDIPVLKGCVNDANSVADLVRNQPNYDIPKVLLNEQATYRAVLDELNKAANELVQGDFLLLHYSGHGMRGVVSNGQLDPKSSANSSWILYDQPLASDELYQTWFKFQPHASILVLSDSCHSGRAIKDRDISFGPGLTERGLDDMATIQVLSNNIEYYKARDISLQSLRATAAAPNVNVVLISGCQEDQTALDGADSSGTPHGLFTAAVLEVMKGGFSGDYNSLYNEVRNKVSAQTQQKQTPNYLWVGGNFFELGMFGRLKPPFKV